MGRPLTPMADPELDSALGAYAVRPATVGDLLAARGANGHRVVVELDRQCALEAARVAPSLADQLTRDHPDLLASIAARHPPSLIEKCGPLFPRAALCAEVAALLALEMVAAVREQLADVPLSPEATTA
jgi:hypothetical protein